MREGRREGSTEAAALCAPPLCCTRRSWGHQAKLKIESCEAEGNFCNSFELQAKLFHRENCTRGMYKLKYFQFRERREIRCQVDGHNRWRVFLHLCFIFDPGMRLWSKSHLSLYTVLCFESQSSSGVHNLGSFWMKLDWNVPSRRAPGKFPPLRVVQFMGSGWLEVISPLEAHVLWVLRAQQQPFALQVCCCGLANLFLSWLSSDCLKRVDWAIDSLCDKFARGFVMHTICRSFKMIHNLSFLIY